MLAAESAFGMLQQGLLMEAYWENLRNSWIWRELYAARNFRPVSFMIESLQFCENCLSQCVLSPTLDEML